MSDRNPAVLILAAGKGTRMKSSRPKVLHEILGRTLVEYVLNAARYLEPSRLVVVTGFGAAEVEEKILESLAFGDESARPVFVRQTEQLGTGHAVATARPALVDHEGALMILCGDVPLIAPQTLLDFMDAHRALAADLSVLTMNLSDPAEYGRIIRDEKGWLARIVEARDADEAELAVTEVNSGLYLADCRQLFESVDRLNPDNDQREYYLTDAVADFRSRGLNVAAVEAPDARELSGINDREELAAAGAYLQERINRAWLKAGVTMMDPANTYIEAGVRLARDVTIYPGVVLTGKTRIESGASLGPFAWLHNCRVGEGAVLGPHLHLSEVTVAAGRKYPPKDSESGRS